MVLRIGLREANQRFSQAIKTVKAGRKVVLTERGKPVAVIISLAHAEDLESTLRSLRVQGLLRAAPARGRLRTWTPKPLRGKPITDTLREERDAG